MNSFQGLGPVLTKIFRGGAVKAAKTAVSKKTTWDSRRFVDDDRMCASTHVCDMVVFEIMIS